MGNHPRISGEGVQKFIDSIDWGWFFFLTKPIFWLLHNINALIGNMGWSIIGLTLIIKAILFPLAFKSYVSMAKMKELAAADGGPERGRRRRPPEDAAGHDGAVQEGKGEPGRGLFADPDADPDLLLAV